VNDDKPINEDVFEDLKTYLKVMINPETSENQ